MERISLKWNSPAASLVIGLVAFPLAKLLYIPNYVFNFLTTLVHECGHSLFAWLMGMPSLPTASVAGGGVTVWGEQRWYLCVAALAGIVALAWRHRQSPGIWIPLAVAALIYPLLAFTGAHELVAIAGGVALECLGAAACFFTVLAVALERPFERPLYALWGWWMILNRGAETILMMRSRAYWESHAVIDSGLAAGLTSDLGMLRQKMGISPMVLLGVVLTLCLAALPGAFAAARLRRIYVDRSE
ncbi:MAG TPA: hypothetical protein VK661_00845 [Planctomycetota bacterium]|nr:hypothetical protein [Planctomycetota bacterium]